MRHEGVKVIQSLSHPPYVGETLSRQYGGSDAQIYFPSSIVYNASFTRSYFLQPDVSAWLYVCRLHVYLYSVMELEDWNNDVHVNNHSLKLSLSLSHTHLHTAVGEVIKCLVRSKSNSVYCEVNPVRDQLGQRPQGVTVLWFLSRVITTDRQQSTLREGL